ncbi:hypothetical protein NBG89_30070 (plasmid) [Rhizobium sp. YTU87027]
MRTRRLPPGSYSSIQAEAFHGKRKRIGDLQGLRREADCGFAPQPLQITEAEQTP